MAGSKLFRRPSLSKSRQVYIALRERITRGVYDQNGGLPGEQTLAAEMGVSRVTLRRALASLEEDGVIDRRRGAGTFLSASGKPAPITVDLADARIVSALLDASGLSKAGQEQVHAALAGKDATELRSITGTCKPEIGAAIQALVELYGGVTVLDQAARLLPALPAVRQALAELQWLASHVANPGVGPGPGPTNPLGSSTPFDGVP